MRRLDVKAPWSGEALLQNLERNPKAPQHFCRRTPAPVSVGQSRRAAQACHPALGTSTWQEKTPQIHSPSSSRGALFPPQHPKATVRAPGMGGISGLAEQPQGSIKLWWTLAQSVLQHPHSKGAGPIRICGGRAGCHRLSVPEAQESLTGKKWPNPPCGTGPEAAFIPGRDHLQPGSLKDPSRDGLLAVMPRGRRRLESCLALPRSQRILLC